MPENRFCCGTSGGGRESVYIETNRILDSCRDRDCFENVRVFLTDFGNEIIEHTNTVRARSACIAWTSITLDPVQFNRGFYSVTIRFYIKLIFEACVGGGRSQEFDGIAVLEKKIILFGGEGNVSVFRSSTDGNGFCDEIQPCIRERSLPVATVEVVDPIVLDTRIIENVNECRCCCCSCDVPECVIHSISGALSNDTGCVRERYLAVSIGIFSVVRITRPAQLLITASEYSVPDKECVEARKDDPCGIFRSMSFPTSEFTGINMPVIGCDRGQAQDKGNKCGCGG